VRARVNVCILFIYLIIFHLIHIFFCSQFLWGDGLGLLSFDVPFFENFVFSLSLRGWPWLFGFDFLLSFDTVLGRF
jgi:hypothetical protein